MRQILARDPDGDGVTLTGIFDSDLSARCEVSNDESGTPRCFPPSFGELFFADASCSIPIAAADAVCSGRSFVLAETGPPPCVQGEEAWAVYESGDPIAAPDTVYASIAGHCVSASGTKANQWRSLRPVPKESFVAFQKVVERRSPALSARVLVGDDGSRFVDSVVNTETNSDCAFEPTPGLPESLACVPKHVAVTTTGDFDSSACDHPAASASSDPAVCGAPELVVTRGACGIAPTFAKVGPALPATSVFEQRTTCGQIEQAPVSAWFFQAGEAVPSSSLPVVTVARLGTHRVGAVQLMAEDGSPLMPARNLFDTAGGHVCWPADFPDGTTRCVSASVQTGTEDDLVYADPQCTSPLIITYDFPSCPELEATTAFAVTQPVVCGPRKLMSALYLAGSVTTGPTYARSGADCVPDHVVGATYRLAQATTDYDAIAPIVNVQVE